MYNPFKENRTEQMQELWRYYVPVPGIINETRKPLVIEGGRGSGKTMFFQCNSWKQLLLQFRKNQKTTSSMFDENEFIGIYYRVDTTFVSSMCDKGEDNWGGIFQTYLSICILQEFIDFIGTLVKDMPIEENEISNFIEEFSKRFNPSSNVNTLDEFKRESNKYLDYIEDKINGLADLNDFGIRYVNAQRIIKDMCVSCNKIFKRELTYKIFIDEYETLQEYQQKIVNTLIKHSSLPVIFNIGLRPKGMKTKMTISLTETIEAPHDYEMLTLGFNEPSIYPTILKEICRKRIVMGKERGKIPHDASEDIEDYLGVYSIADELKRIEKSNVKFPHLKRLAEKINSIGKSDSMSDEEIEKCTKILCYDAPLVNSRLHYALLCKKTVYTPSLNELLEAYTNNSKRYQEWMHNRKYGLIFLLCKETKRDKLYYGFDVYTALSSNTVRYFLELCEQAFRIAFLSDFNWDTMITADQQTEAARYVSEYKIVDIAGYEPYGKELRIFTQYLGQIFNKLHTDENTTLGEPEPNHFSTKDLSLDENTKKMIASAIMWNVLQEGETTKKKQSKLSPETVDYYLNKIYVPYFGISYRNQRKIQLEVDFLKDLFAGNEKVAKSAFMEYFRNNKILACESDNISPQFTLFDSIGGE